MMEELWLSILRERLWQDKAGAKTPPSYLRAYLRKPFNWRQAEYENNGDRIAIVFIPQTATGYGGEYGVGSWVEWIYTYTENA